MNIPQAQRRRTRKLPGSNQANQHAGQRASRATIKPPKQADHRNRQTRKQPTQQTQLNSKPAEGQAPTQTHTVQHTRTQTNKREYETHRTRANKKPTQRGTHVHHTTQPSLHGQRENGPATLGETPNPKNRSTPRELSARFWRQNYLKIVRGHFSSRKTGPRSPGAAKTGG